MEENMVNETIEEATIDDFYDDVEEASGIGFKILMGGAALAAGVAGGLVYKNKEKIKDAWNNAKEKRRQKAVKKTMDKLAKLEAKAPKPKQETETE